MSVYPYAVPLVVVGALDLRNMWRLGRAQLDDSVKQQVDLASVALDAIAAFLNEKTNHG